MLGRLDDGGGCRGSELAFRRSSLALEGLELRVLFESLLCLLDDDSDGDGDGDDEKGSEGIRCTGKALMYCCK